MGRSSTLPALIVLATFATGIVAETVTVTVTSSASDCSQSSLSLIDTTYKPTGTGTGAYPSPTKELNEYAKEAGKLYFGTASDIPPVDDQGAELYDQGYMSLLNDSNMFGQRTPANIMKARISYRE